MGLQNLTFGIVAEVFDDSQTTLDLSASHGTRFDAADLPEQAVLWNTTDYTDPAVAFWAGQAEILTVSSKSTDELTVARGDEGTTPISATVGKTYRVSVSATQEVLEALGNASRHELGGSDEISVAGLSGLLATGQNPVAASETVVGGAEIATQAETDAGTDDTRMVTPAKLAAFSGLELPYAILEDQKTSGTNGGTFTSGAWRTRNLNTEVVDDGAIVTISSNQFTLGAGTYRIIASAGAAFVGLHQVRLRNITDSTNELIGTSAECVSEVQDRSWIDGVITIAGTKTFELQHRCETTITGDGFGQAVGAAFTVDHEVYSRVVIVKES